MAFRHRCTIPIARHTLDQVMRDETRHRQFGWDVLDWALLAGGHTALELVVDQTPAMISQVRTAYTAAPSDHSHTQLKPEVLAWGLAPPCDYATVLSATIDSDLLPRLAARGATPH